MKRKSFIDQVIMKKPNQIMSIGFILIIITGFLGEFFSWGSISYHPFSDIWGAIIIIAGWILHITCHKYHKQAHKNSNKIDNIVNTGPFRIIRHPMYLSLILMYLGIALAWGIVWIFIPSIVFSLLTIMIARSEERYLLNKLGDQYQNYMRQVPWRFIPKIF